jgi:hypothetical protein
VLVRHGLDISSLAYYPTTLNTDPGERLSVNNHM